MLYTIHVTYTENDLKIGIHEIACVMRTSVHVPIRYAVQRTHSNCHLEIIKICRSALNVLALVRNSVSNTHIQTDFGYLLLLHMDTCTWCYMATMIHRSLRMRYA